jgi:hypothetical protein
VNRYPRPKRNFRDQEHTPIFRRSSRRSRLRPQHGGHSRGMHGSRTAFPADDGGGSLYSRSDRGILSRVALEQQNRYRMRGYGAESAGQESNVSQTRSKR